MSTRRPQHCSIKVSGQNPTPEQAQKYAYVDKYPADRMESGFFEVKTTAAFSTATTKTAPAVFVKLVFALLLTPVSQTTFFNGRYVVLTVGKA